MKKLFILLISVLIALPFAVHAQDDPTVGTNIAYGDTVSGEVSNRVFETLYFFEGKAGDVVQIEMIASESADLDAYLYLTTVENEIIAQNDDYFGLNSRIVARLPADGTYQIVATRLGQRTGRGQGAYRLTLQQVRIAASGITLEGTAVYAETPPTHVFVPESAGIYTISYRNVRGDYFPSVVISRLQEGSAYEEDIGTLGGRFLRAGEITLELDLDSIYVLSLEQSYYSNTNTGATAVYTLSVEEVEP
jgi:hypothetical protein